jgi:hypothetical protein
MLISVDDATARPWGLATMGLVAASALGCGNDDSGGVAPTASTQDSTLIVDGVLRAGDEFEASFTGRLRELRGGYLWVQSLDGAQVALLRSDGNPEIPMGYTVDSAEFEMLADGLTDETSSSSCPQRSRRAATNSARRIPFPRHVSRSRCKPTSRGAMRPRRRLAEHYVDRRRQRASRVVGIE